MEPTKKQIKPIEGQMKTNWVIYTSPKLVEKWGGGWWVQFDGSWESLYFGDSKPFDIGDKIKITFERVEP